MVSFDDFTGSLSAAEPPAGVRGPLKGLWLAARGDWAGAHDLVQDDDSQQGAWVHAHLHRAEGDLDNAAYWYARAGRPLTDVPLEMERLAIARALIQGVNASRR